MWFVMVKGTQKRFEGNSNWGWGWALFQAKDEVKRNVSTNWRIDCMGCHTPVRGDDWIYLRGYPSLQKSEE